MLTYAIDDETLQRIGGRQRVDECRSRGRMLLGELTAPFEEVHRQEGEHEVAPAVGAAVFDSLHAPSQSSTNAR